MNQTYLQLYADFIVKVGVNVQPRQNFLIRCPVSMPDFAHACVKAGYEAGAKDCIVRWEDDKLTRLRMEYGAEADLAALKPYELRSYLDYAEDPDGCCTLAIHADDPEALAGLDAAKINRVNLARRNIMKPWQEYTMNDRVQWCVAAVPAPAWAAKVFPDLPQDQAVEKLWELIFDVCRVSTGDPVTAWREHVAAGKHHRDQLNAWNLDHIRMVSSNGTDLTIGLADDATWEGATSKAENGTEFIANVPTEEVFCAPHRERVNGIVYGTKPYVYNGQLIEGWHVTFRDGAVVEHGAEKNAALLAELLSTDANANRIGEIALVPASSPINRSGVLFYNTLFDENAACHIAFGAGYPTNIRGGSTMTREQLMRKGLNDSAIHEDVMIGAPDTCVTGVTKDGREVEIFRDGEWAF
ncbi:MAG: aminopeptidase [Gemmiger sp.]|uniref:aminopeptidase n=1 Tax=Gemmiger sp. TaxID=2049027 RepID=UPI002E797482|nr:aminopeptidase [Gemmiger sp.]MEE0800231.1 aminopeptidase [Gemmiger sp.]